MDNDNSNIVPTITTAEIPDAIKAAMESNLADPEAQISLYLEGAPGTSKTAQAKAVAKAMGWNFTHIACNHLDLVEGKGYPIYNKSTDQVEFKPISIWPTTKGPNLLLLDEFPSAIPPVQASLSGLLQGGTMGDYTLPAETLIVLTGNRQSDKAATYKIPSQLRSRVTRLGVKVSTEGWLLWAKDHGINKAVMEFVATKPELLHAFDSDAEIMPTLRGWHKVSAIMASNGSDAMKQALMAGSVGLPAASEFIAFSRSKVNLPKPSEILADPSGCRIPTDPGDLQTLAGAMARGCTPSRTDAYLTYIRRLDGEYMTVFATTARAQNMTNENAILRGFVNHVEERNRTDEPF